MCSWRPGPYCKTVVPITKRVDVFVISRRGAGGLQDRSDALQRRKLAIEQRRKLPGPELKPGVEGAELGKLGARLVEPHFIDQFLEHEGILCEQIDAPFPIVEPDRARDDLRHLARVVPAD